MLWPVAGVGHTHEHGGRTVTYVCGNSMCPTYSPICPGCKPQAQRFENTFPMPTHQSSQSWKCPECGAWIAWWVHEHRCETKTATSANTAEATPMSMEDGR